jgi:hypothetical protein
VHELLHANTLPKVIRSLFLEKNNKQHDHHHVSASWTILVPKTSHCVSNGSSGRGGGVGRVALSPLLFITDIVS